MNQVTLHPKEMILMFVTYGDLVSTFWGVWVSQTLQICGSGFNSPEKKKREKRKNDLKQREEQMLLALGDLMRSSKKFFIEGNSLFLAR